MKKIHRNITKHGINMVLLPIFMQRETYRNMVVNMDKPAFMQRENYRNMMVNLDFASPVLSSMHITSSYFNYLS